MSEDQDNRNSEKSPEAIRRERELQDKLEWLLKEGYKELGLRILPENYFFIEDIILLPDFQQYSWGDIREATHSDGKLRFSIRGSKIRLKPPELNKDPDVILSKKLAWILRHGAEKEGLQFEDGGFLYIDILLRMHHFAAFTFDDIKRVVDNNDKKRFLIQPNPENGRMQVRANQGHTIKVEGLSLRLITDPQEFTVVIHGTYFKNWNAIRESGLKTMGRTHIHFAPGEVGEDGVISGMRGSAEVIIYMDLPLAMKDGIEFHISDNNVILTAGDQDGRVKKKYFKAAYQRSPRVELEFVRSD